MQPLALNGTTFVLNHTYASVGHYDVVVKVTDDLGRTGTDTALVNVIYAFAGFFAPIDNPPAVNSARAGSSVPIKFSLSGYQGASPFAVGSEQYDCTTGESLGALEPTVNPGASGVQYDATTDQYQYNWKTDKAWDGTCRQLAVLLNDDTVYVAQFQFR